MTTTPVVNQVTDESIGNNSILVSNNEQKSKRERGEQELDWKIINVKIVCFVCIVISWIIATIPYASLARFLTSPEVNTTGSANTQMERIDSICRIINNSTLELRGNRSSNLNLECEYPYVTNGSLCVPICGAWHPGGQVYYIVARVVACIAASISLIFSLLGITTWFIVGKKLFEFPQVIPFYLFICAIIQALCILIGQIQFSRFYCSHQDLINSRSHTTPQCYIQGAIYHYTSFVFIFWYVSYVVAVLLILSFPIKLRLTESNNWKPHLIVSLVSTCVPFLILVVFWGVDPERYIVYNHPIVCSPGAIPIVVLFIVPVTLTLGLSLTCVFLIVSQLIINQLRLRRHITSAMNKKQTQFIIRTLGVIIIFTVIILILVIEFGTRLSFVKPFESYVELYWACITRYGTNSSCCVDNYSQFYHPEFAVLADFLLSIWGMVALSTFAVKDAREFWINLFRKCFRCCYHNVSSPPTKDIPEINFNTKTQPGESRTEANK